MSKKSKSTTPPPTPPTPSSINPPQANPFNKQAVKEYVFNETGNIMLSTTDIKGSQITESVRDIFSEVAVFFAAMTKAISTTIDPSTGQPYSLYDYSALQNVIDGSGLFVQVTEESVTNTTTAVGANFSKELIGALLGLATGAGELSFAGAMIASMGSAAVSINASTSSSSSEVANIIFVCEYLLGMPIVSAIVVSCDASSVSETVTAGPCFSETATTTTLVMQKDTYLFVTPQFIQEYSGDLESVTTNQEYLEFVNYLQSLVSATPLITAVEILGNNSIAPQILTVGTTYVILGNFLDNNGNPTDVEVAWVGTNDTTPGTKVASAEVQSNMISFSPTAMTTPTAIGVYFSDGKSTPTWTLATKTPMVYTAITSSTDLTNLTNPILNYTPASSISISKSATGSTAIKSVTISLTNAGTDTIHSVDIGTIVDNKGNPYTALTSSFSKSTLTIETTYTKPSTPATTKGEIPFTATLSDGTTLSGSIGFKITS